MRRQRFLTAAPLGLLLPALALALGLAPVAARAQGVATGLQPAFGFVAPGAEFDVDFVVKTAGASFNGFHATFGYDPAVLTLMQASRVDDQRGCLMTGGCSAACGQTFHQFQAAGDSLSVDLSLLCDQFFLTGPGQLYRLHFLASSTDQVTYVTTRNATFLNSGVFVAPVSTANSRIVIGAPLGVDGGPARVLAARVRVEPNPAQGPVALAIAATRDGVQQVDVLDLSGRIVRHLSAGWQPRGTRNLAWDGTDASGQRVAAGVYLVRLRAGEDVALTRLAMLR